MRAMTHDASRQKYELLLTVPEAAFAMKMGKSRVYQMVRKGEIKSVKIGKSRRLLKAAVDEYVARLAGEMEMAS